ncbi:MAG: hypothetical protein EPO62_02430 [Candidatus Nitrosotenuis sp.]|nr:MAG: hypothetical protein EPO62_02430 [Candidatus Nitrosotenuis sp.]
MRKTIKYFSLVTVTGISIIFLATDLSSWLYPVFVAAPGDRKEISLKETISLTSNNLKNSMKNSSPANPPNDPMTHMGVIIVPYFATTSQFWETIYLAADEYPGTIRYVIINPCSGPCNEPLSTDWQRIISELKSRNINTLGYIFDIFQSKENIDYYMVKPQIPTDGIFFDNEGTSDTIDRFKQYADYVHSLGGAVYINPGFNYPHVTNYLKEGLADVANMYEFESSKAHHISIDASLQPQQVSAILGEVFTVLEMRKMIYESAQAGVGTIYVYSDSYDSLPTFFSEMVRESADTKVKR